MWPFLVFGGIYAGAASLGRPGKPATIPWAALFLITVLFVGLRHHVGMDWNNYLRMIHSVDTARDMAQALSVSEPFYALLLAFGNWTGGGMYVVNFISTCAVMLGVFAFARRTPEPWLALAGALPMFIVVVSMSANRQALAAGLIMLVMAYWSRLSLPVRAGLIVLIAGFHASAVVFLAFVAIDLKLPRAIKFGGIAVFGLLAIYILQQSGFGDYYNQSYGEGQNEYTQSSGAFYHVALNAIPASLYFLLPKYRSVLFPTPLLRNIAFAAIATALLVPFASAAAGRITLYWFPMSMWVWATLPSIVQPWLARPARLFIAGTMFAIMVFWLMFANSSAGHIPYGNALFLEPWELEIGVLP
uniref:EpsG family protein n=1 Tax=Parerythrobacter lutipelagi TaxID=1964208 RepID=UPI0010F62A9C|nr:EpsG family protein [Parerythrobacter lutipelagi]